MKHLSLILGALLCAASLSAEDTQLSASDISTLYQSSYPTTISIHDPSVVLRNGTYYIWGSHLGVARSADLVSWTALSASSSTFIKLSNQGDASGTRCDYNTAFNTQQATQVKNYAGETVTFPNFDAEAYAARYADDPTTWVSGCMWAPDIIYNETMQKWCMYLSINGDNWSSIIILLTADAATGPFTYQGPVVMGGFCSTKFSGIATPTISETDYEIATGETTFASRYARGSSNGTYWPNCIDPCTFFDEDGELWMAYGSWSGGIFMLKLDKETGLRDYTYTYESDYSSSGASGTSDPYFGKKIAGGYYVSGEGPYIQHIGDYYYLFMSYGFYSPDGGYEMRIFRSSSPDGPYVDANGTAATYTKYQLNYGASAATTRGMRLMSSYNTWGDIQTIGERAQGHNSACVDDQGRAFVVYHTKFNDGTAGHQVRVHQLFVNEKGWLVCAPFIYQGETQSDETIAASQKWTDDELAGTYKMLLHKYGEDYANYAEIEPVEITLSADGKVTGSYTGTWSRTEGTDYVSIKLGSTTYYGVFCEQQINGATASNLCSTTLKAQALTAVATSGVCVWAYKLEPSYAVAWNYKNATINVSEGKTYSQNISLMFDTDQNTELTWTSTAPDVISETGKYNPADTTTSLTLTAKLACQDYYWQQEYNVKAKKATTLSADYMTGIVAYYDFDEQPTYNNYLNAEGDFDKATYSHYNSGTTPTLGTDYDRFGQVVNLSYGAVKYNSYVRIPNPLAGLDIEGFTVSLWIKRTDSDAWDALWGFIDGTAATSSYPRFYLTGNNYVGYNDAADTWFDLNYPSTTYTDITVGEWVLVTVTVGATNGVRTYINGTNKSYSAISASDGTTSSKKLPYSNVVETVTGVKYFFLGNGSFWGSAAFAADDLLIYNRELTASEVSALNQMLNRVNDFTTGEGGNGSTGIETIESDTPVQRSAEGIYDLTGRRVAAPQKGIYIVDGKKILY